MKAIIFTPYATVHSGGITEHYTKSQYDRLHSRVDKDIDKPKFQDAFTMAGIKTEKWWSLANGYWPPVMDYFEISTNWFLVKTSLGLIEIGRRKRVISIDWSETPVRKLITEDDVTKSETYVHAWSLDKAAVYLINLKQAFYQLKGEPL